MTPRKNSLRALTLAAAATLLAGAVQADELKPARAASLDLGPLAGIAYYTAEPDGHHVVVTLAPRAAAPASRVEAVLASGQSLTVSTPRHDGAAARTVTITRRGETTTVEAVAIRNLDSAALN